LTRFRQDSLMPTQSTTKPLKFEGVREADEKRGMRWNFVGVRHDRDAV